MIIYIYLKLEDKITKEDMYSIQSSFYVYG